jgi:transcriptional regulator with GAF, ATPase, and Fis domain
MPCVSDVAEGLIGASVAVERLRELINSAARCTAKVLITGESGVGKEVVARLIHDRSIPPRRLFVALNCAALPDSLLESELFGHVRGSFTGAFRDKPGLLETADHGTAFLDEIGETSLRLQGLLLRFLETGEIHRVGSDNVSLHSHVRVIAATNRHLPELIEENRFRQDLYFRLNVLAIHVPPLRERREDIPLFLSHFSRVRAGSLDTREIHYTPAALKALVDYDWPGNIRELRNMTERLAALGPATIDVRDLPREMLGPVSPRPVQTTAGLAVRPIVGELLDGMLKDGACFWDTVYALFTSHDITRDELRLIVADGLQRTRGSYRGLVRLFNMPPDDYRRFLHVLRKHDCHIPPLKFRSAAIRLMERAGAGAAALLAMAEALTWLD